VWFAVNDNDHDLKTLFINFLSTFGRQLFAGIVGLAISVIIARFYGPHGNGVFAVTLLLPNILAIFLNCGIGPANVYFLGSNQADIKEVIQVNFFYGLSLSFFGLTVGIPVLLSKGELIFPGIDSALLIMALFTFPMVLVTGLFSSIFHGLQDFRSYNKILIVQPTLFLGFLVPIVLLENHSLDILVGTHMLVSLTVLIYTSVLIRKLHLSSTNEKSGTTGYGRKAVGYGWKVQLGNLFGFANYKIDMFLVNLLLNASSAGIYVIAVTLAEKLWIISNAVSTVLLPRLSELWLDEEKRRNLTPFVSRLVFLVTLIGCIALAVIAHPLIVLVFGADYAVGVTPLLLLLPGIAVIGAARVWANDIAARGLPEINMYISFLTLVINVSCNLFLIPRFGLEGAAMATTISYIVCAVSTLTVYIRLTSNSWASVLFVNMADIAKLKNIINSEASQ
jgi:O-antigen/teichoic acid export membrane protein